MRTTLYWRFFQICFLLDAVTCLLLGLVIPWKAGWRRPQQVLSCRSRDSNLEFGGWQQAAANCWLESCDVCLFHNIFGGTRRQGTYSRNMKLTLIPHDSLGCWRCCPTISRGRTSPNLRGYLQHPAVIGFRSRCRKNTHSTLASNLGSSPLGKLSNFCTWTPQTTLVASCC